MHTEWLRDGFDFCGEKKKLILVDRLMNLIMNDHCPLTNSFIDRIIFENNFCINQILNSEDENDQFYQEAINNE